MKYFYSILLTDICKMIWLLALIFWVTGLIFVLLEKENRFVRFYARHPCPPVDESTLYDREIPMGG